MPTANNFDELFKMLHNEDIVYDQLVGETIEYTCPNCNEDVKIKLLQGKKAICPSCKQEIRIHFKIK